MKFNFLVICISIFALFSCNISSEKKIDELSIIIISSDISIGENVINFAVLDINGNQINNDLNEIKLKNLESENETIISAKYQNWFKGKGAYNSKIYINETGFHELIVTFNKYESRAIFNVNTKSVTPTIDKKPPNILTLTAKSKTDLKNITSDSNPDIDLYSTSYEESINSNIPTIVLFSTPALCVSGTCGPILDSLKKIKKQYKDYNFIHVEVYKNFIGKTLRDLDSLEVTEPVIKWGLPTEPWMFFIDKNGILRAKFEGFISEEDMIIELDRIGNF